jgi:glutaredoxin-like protein NrdH
MSDYTVRVYTRKGCGPCQATKAYLGKYSIRFDEIDTTGDTEVQDLLVSAGFHELPIVEYDIPGYGSGSWSGHRSEKLEDLSWVIRGEAE